MDERKLPACGVTIEQFAQIAAAAEFTSYENIDRIIAAISDLPDKQFNDGVRKGSIEIEGCQITCKKSVDRQQLLEFLEINERTRLQRKWLSKTLELLSSGHYRVTAIPQGHHDRVEIDADLLARSGWKSHHDFAKSVLAAAGRTFDGVRIFDRSATRMSSSGSVGCPKPRSDGLPRGARVTGSNEKKAVEMIVEKVLEEELRTSARLRRRLKEDLEAEFAATRRTGKLGPIIESHMAALGVWLKSDGRVKDDNDIRPALVKRVQNSSERAVSDGFRISSRSLNQTEGTISMHSDKKLDAPGLKRRGKSNERLHWVARADIAKAGFLPKTVRLHYDENNHAHRPLIEAACHKLQAEMLEWAGGKRNNVRTFDGTLGSLVRCYQTDEASPYRQIKWNTQRTYDQVLGVIEKAFGTRTLSAIGIADFRKWYDVAKMPKAKGQPERIRKAHGIISMIRRLMEYGVAAEHAGCARLAVILKAARFKEPGRRRARLELHHVEAFITKALEVGRLSLAIGTAIQFETLMRQRDVIGEWEPIRDGERTGIVLNDRRWVNGLTWADLSNNLEVFKDTTKTGQTVAHDLKLIPMVVRLLNMVPPESRVGPLVIDEEAQRPYAMHGYTREWRVVATAAGIPKGLWNMDARAGGISEADDAGADLDDIRSTAGHSQASTTVHYIRGGMGKSRKVTKGRQASRTVKNGTET